eukprot:NODE_4471_length_658_cov_47.558292_g3822_i0.p2 GENE.NODE_4471_length_658_cov_47.558292_g3822_i0~~NODE_4471_length_658_cov_47.558292_g3822_i0.p2  ORF type:complete len:75 (+),score=5.37 NODE_4471_length_658_cov_47.558292_g3822_i0:358-582(+)
MQGVGKCHLFLSNDEQPQAEESCVVCCQRQRNAILIPCGHLALCTVCALDLCDRGQPCPVCRIANPRVFQVFRV